MKDFSKYLTASVARMRKFAIICLTSSPRSIGRIVTLPRRTTRRAFVRQSAEITGEALTNLTIAVMYNFKYAGCQPEKANKMMVIRQIGVYHQYNSITESLRWILLQAPNTLRERFRNSILSAQNECQSHLLLHTAIVGIATESWQKYLSYWERDFRRLVSTITTNLPNI